MSKTLRTVTVALCALLFLPLAAQEKNDTVYTFRFVPEDDMFYVPYGGNDAELERLEECVARYKAEILGGKIPLRVDGHCSAGNDSLAKIRSNRVKSELITRQQLTEDCFITKNHSGSGDYVTVRITVAPSTPPEGGAMVTSDVTPDEAYINNKVEDTSVEQDPITETQSLPSGEVGGAGARIGARTWSLSLRANLLRWATLTPDLGIEWRISPSVAVMVNGSWTSWTWNDNARRYALWEVAPEVRWYLGEKKAWYVGAMFKAGQFNYKFSGTGRQGDLLGGGITGGYQLRLTEALSMDFTLGLGYLNADTEKYEVIEGVRVRSGNETKHWIGPINAGVTLVWKMKN